MITPFLGQYSTKEEIYHIVSVIKRYLGLSDQYGIDSLEVAKSLMDVEILPFDETDICGILYKGKSKSTMALNALRTSHQQNFDCSHELIHFFAHEINAFKCICSENRTIRQERWMEYQANEGAAEFIIPYEYFVPEVSGVFCDSLSYSEIDGIISDLAAEYHVSESVIKIRMQSLKYEIYQYSHGVQLYDLEILSESRQKKRGIAVKSIPEIRDYKQLVEDFGDIPADNNIAIDF
jgi:Zn-dependent peptidase ImmA (M78 family)